jgi:hypothetical protein
MPSRKYRAALRHLELDALIILLSIIGAYLIVRTGALSSFVSLSQGMVIIAAFVAGIFFTSMITAAAAAVALATLGGTENIWLISFIGALGAVCGDMILFLFIRDTITEDLKAVIKSTTLKRLTSYLHGGFFRWIAPIIGGIIIASPLPDEVGLALMGMSKVRSYYVIPLSFVMNLIGIWAIISIAHAV